MVILKRFYVENYKLFSKKELDFSNALLFVFDGANGYGKTSIFDAVELLVTGKISRVLDCESIDGKLSYQTVFFAKNSEKDVILKAEFENDEADRCFTLGARIKSSNINGKLANPRNIFNIIEFFHLPTYDTPVDSWKSYLKNSDEIDVVRKCEFGQQNIEQFTLLHYIRQEDRLAYFKQSEASRASAIENLLGVTEERNKYKSIQRKRKDVEKIYKQVSEEIKRKKEYVIEHAANSDHATEYEPLIDGVQEWDKRNVFFGDSNPDKILARYFTELERIESYVKYADVHSKYFSYEEFKKNPKDLRTSSLLALILLQKSPMSIDDIEIAYQNLKFLIQQRDKIELQEYTSLNLAKIYKIIEAPEDESLIKEIRILLDISRHQDELQKKINNVIKIREHLHRSYDQILEDGICPYCGNDWSKQEKLEKQFADTKIILQKCLTHDGSIYSKQLEIIKFKIEEDILVKLKNKIAELLEKDIIEVYEKFGSRTNFVSAIEHTRPLFNVSYSMLVAKDSGIENDNGYLGKMIEMCRSIGNMIPVEYISANEKYIFSEVRKKYALNDEIITMLQRKRFDKKRRYLQEQFFRSFDKIKEEIHGLEFKQKTINTLQNQLKEYENAVKNSIEAYKKQIIDEIEIPFFVYSSRLLQSYQGGQGVLMKNDGGSIRFTAPGKEHDILYTMSSGQLSAVLLSFSLALNKIYSGEGIKMLLIDDPIQCMDDINMISFVELLRREFSRCQILLSTHEEDFSNFIRYKFKKYGLDTKEITLKDA